MCAKLTELGNSKNYFITYKRKEKGIEMVLLGGVCFARLAKTRLHVVSVQHLVMQNGEDQFCSKYNIVNYSWDYSDPYLTTGLSGTSYACVM